MNLVLSTNVLYLVFLKLEVCPLERNYFAKGFVMRIYAIKSLNQAPCERVYFSRTNL